MTRPSQLLFVTLLMVGSSLAQAQVAAKDDAAAHFQPATVGAEAKKPAETEHPQLTVRDEIANDVTEGASCEVSCHPVFTVNSKTHLVKFDLNKIK